MPLLYRWLGAPLLVTLFAAAPASDDSIDLGSPILGSVTLRLGMPRDAVLSTLKARNYVVGNPVPPEERVAVADTSQKVADIVGYLIFRGGVLRHVDKSWGPRGRTDVDVGNTLYGVVSSFVREGRRHCTIDVTELHNPGIESKGVIITCGRKSIGIKTIKVEQLSSNPVTVIDENLDDVP